MLLLLVAACAGCPRRAHWSQTRSIHSMRRRHYTTSWRWCRIHLRRLLLLLLLLLLYLLLQGIRWLCSGSLRLLRLLMLVLLLLAMMLLIMVVVFGSLLVVGVIVVVRPGRRRIWLQLLAFGGLMMVLLVRRLSHILFDFICYGCRLFTITCLLLFSRQNVNNSGSASASSFFVDDLILYGYRYKAASCI